MRILAVLICLLSFISSGSYAQTATPEHGVALHGAPKYKKGFSHFDYVNPDAPKGGTLKSGVIGTFDSLNPFIVKGVPSAGFEILGAGLVYESLMDQSYDEPFSMYGVLAESIERPKDNSWVAFTVNSKAKWADGKPVTAEDVVFSFETLMKDGQPFFKAYYADIANVKATSDRRVIFTFKHNENKELPMIVSQLPVLPKHYWTAEGRNFAATSLSPPLGSGPYKVSHVDPGRSITFTRNDDWWGKDLGVNKGRYNFDRIVYDYYKDDSVSLEAFLAHQYDIRQENVAKIWATGYNTPAVKDGRIVRESIQNKRPQGMQAFLFNTRRPVFADPKVREALSYAFDFEWSNRQFAFNSYKRSASFFENTDLAAHMPISKAEEKLLTPFKDQLPPQVFSDAYTPPVTDGSGNARDNLKKAAQILEDAGWKLGPDGIRAKDGVKLKFQIIDSNPMLERWCLPFMRNLKRIGVEADMRVIDQAQFVNRIQAFDFDMTNSVIAQSNSPGNEQLEFWHSTKADVPASRNYIGIKNPVVDSLVNTIIRANSREDLVTATRALDRVLLWNYYVIPQWYVDSWRLAYWSDLKRPENVSDLSPGIVDTWWKDETKKAK
jgi:microcin C transport system substrate-binding protein